MIILGVDPGTVKTGYGLVQEDGRVIRPLKYGVIKLSSRLSITERLKQIYHCLSEIIEEFNPSIIALENIFFSKNVQSAIKIGEARSVVMLLAGLNHIDIKEYSPARIKQSVVGNGRASKRQVQGMVKTLLELKETPEEDASDALAVALCHYHMRRNDSVS